MIVEWMEMMMMEQPIVEISQILQQRHASLVSDRHVLLQSVRSIPIRNQQSHGRTAFSDPRMEDLRLVEQRFDYCWVDWTRHYYPRQSLEYKDHTVRYETPFCFIWFIVSTQERQVIWRNQKVMPSEGLGWLSASTLGKVGWRRRRWRLFKGFGIATQKWIDGFQMIVVKDDGKVEGSE